jgi:hypothetical protein
MDWCVGPTSKYWTYRSHAVDMIPVTLVACREQKVALSPRLQWLSWERNWVRTCGSVNRRAVDRVVVDDFAKGCYALTTLDMYGLGPYADRAWDVCGMLVGFSLQGIHRFESPRLSDMSNRLFMTINTYLINGRLFINESLLCFTIITSFTTLAWLSSGLSGLRFN